MNEQISKFCIYSIWKIVSILYRFLATGESFRSLAFQFRIHHTWISRTVHSTLAAVVKNLTMPIPTGEMWEKTAKGFEMKWSYPNCIGAIDGKHIRVRCPSNTGSLCYNYKDFFSVVLLAIADANCKFVAVDIGAYGREGDAGVFMRSEFGKRINNGTFNIPPPKPLPGTNVVLPHVIVGDEAFALHENLMKYSRQAATADRTKLVYNFRHSHARRVSENAFGILCATFRIFHTPINCSLEHINNIAMACCIFHNLIRNETMRRVNMEERIAPTENFQPLTPHVRRCTEARYAIRDAFKDYFNGVGATAWQDERIDLNFESL